jgi:hypothetical protein
MPDGRLLLVEGRWWTGGWLSAKEVLALLRARGRAAAIRPLDDPKLWGSPAKDERYLLMSPPSPNR